MQAAGQPLRQNVMPDPACAIGAVAALKAPADLDEQSLVIAGTERWGYG